MSDSTKGIIFCLASYLVYTLGDTSRKYLTQSHDMINIIFWASLFGILVMLIYSIFHGGIIKNIRTEKPTLQAVRAIIVGSTAFMGMYSFKYLPIADIYIIIMVSPIIGMLLSALFFKEKITKFKMLAAFLGMAGALMIIKPGFGVWHIAFLAAIGHSVCFAVSNIMFKVMGDKDSKITYGLYPAVISATIAGLLLMGDLYIPPLIDIHLFIFAGFASFFGTMLLAYGYLKIEASEAGLYGYSLILWGTLAGIIIFSDIPDIYGIAGAFLVLASGYIIYKGSKTDK